MSNLLISPTQQQRLIDVMKSFPIQPKYSKAQLLINELKLSSSGEMEMFYSPHNEYINAAAKVMLVGITPGWQQMEIAYRTAIQALKAHKSYEQACKEAKIAARMAGSMRTNLILMLQEIGLHEYIRVSHVQRLFEADCTLLHTTSLIRYPVLVNKQNYNGHQPSIPQSEFLYQAVLESFLPELEQLKHPLIIPLGKSVEAVLHQLLDEHRVDEEKILWGFPHPSGANGSRVKQFLHTKSGMQNILREWRD
ncbi:hypothetical protein [Paenibacillus sp. 276b]|uniref:hypothetical protein n=1 Tax=Paenibacillus sp. 276b TaxID=1566277 RepID=UPI000899DBDC|nr:hypothetical protein [Paenibacillus sp. 276b]SEA46974.1 hypothetical protein SAMN03159332_1550 [Paenibacillus sp. 276b]